MSITPIDMQNSIARAPDAQKGYNNQTDHNQGAGVNNPDIVEKKIKEDLQNVQHTEDSTPDRKTGKKEEDAENPDTRKRKKREKKQKPKSEPKKAKDGFRGNFIDIKVC